MYIKFSCFFFWFYRKFDILTFIFRTKATSAKKRQELRKKLLKMWLNHKEILTMFTLSMEVRNCGFIMSIRVIVMERSERYYVERGTVQWPKCGVEILYTGVPRFTLLIWGPKRNPAEAKTA